MTDAGFTPTVRTKSLASGWEAELKHGDGHSTTAWGATEALAEANLEEAVSHA